MKLKDRFYIAFRKEVRHYQPFFKKRRTHYITGHRGLEIYIGSLFINLIYKL